MRQPWQSMQWSRHGHQEGEGQHKAAGFRWHKLLKRDTMDSLKCKPYDERALLVDAGRRWLLDSKSVKKQFAHLILRLLSKNLRGNGRCSFKNMQTSPLST
jgi:hypothetical protein